MKCLMGCCICDNVVHCVNNDQGTCKQCEHVIFCNWQDLGNGGDITKCCCGCCRKDCCDCCDITKCRFGYCVFTCCNGRCIVDPCACCCGEYKGDAEKFLENDYKVWRANHKNAPKPQGAPEATVEMAR